MGSRNPDRIHFSEYADVTQTVGEMVKRRWNVRAKCNRCGLTMKARLGDIIKDRGPEFRLWGIASRCRSLECIGGIMTFWASPPGSGFWNELSAENDPAIRTEQRRLAKEATES